MFLLIRKENTFGYKVPEGCFCNRRILMKKLWELYATFFRVGGLTFGGGMAMPVSYTHLDVYKRQPTK